MRLHNSTERYRARHSAGKGGHRWSLALMAWLLATVLGATTVQAQITVLGGGEDAPIPERLITFDTRLEPTDARPGENVRLIISGRIEKGWYTYSLVPVEDEFAPPPTRLKITPGPLALDGIPYETNPTLKTDKVFGIPLAFHPNAVRFYQNMRVPEGGFSGAADVQADVRYQVCNNKFCTPPRTETLTASLTLGEGPPRPAHAFPQRTIDYVDAEGNFRIDADTLEGALAGGLGTFLLIAAGFGLLALLTPCVFPMIPVTVSFFTSAAERGNAAVLRLALLFAAGIILTSTGTGLILTFLLGAAGVSQFATSPWVNMAVAFFFVLFALGLMGVFEMSAPQGLVQRVNRLSGDLKGPVGVILMGMAFTITSFTCTMPFVGTLLVAATQGDIFWPLVGMLVFSTVFAFPFFLLALFPRLVLRLRGKGGNWMVQIKVVLGLVELMAALKFVSNADLIWQWGFFDRELLLALWALLGMLSALLLLGLLPWPGVQVTRRGAGRLAFGGAFVALALYLSLGLFGRELDAYTEAYLPPDLSDQAAMRGGADGVDFVASETLEALPWHPNLPPAQAEALQTGQPLFVDFTGYTCVNCRWMEKKIFAARPVYEALQTHFVLGKFYTDGGDFGEENQQLQVERFRTLALPYYVILSPDGAVLARHAGIMPKPADFLAFLEQGRARLQPAKAPAGTSAENPARPAATPGS